MPCQPRGQCGRGNFGWDESRFRRERERRGDASGPVSCSRPSGPEWGKGRPGGCEGVCFHRLYPDWNRDRDRNSGRLASKSDRIHRHDLGTTLFDSSMQDHPPEAGCARSWRQDAQERWQACMDWGAQRLRIPPRSVVQPLRGDRCREKLGRHQDGLGRDGWRWLRNGFRNLGFLSAPWPALQEKIERILVLLLEIRLTVRGRAELCIVQFAQCVDLFPTMKAIHSGSSIGILAPLHETRNSLGSLR
jgi:hypothetical protein